MAIPAEDVFRKTMTPEQRAAASHRAQELLAEYMTLQEVRKARNYTQVQLAKLWHKDQVAISQIERRADMLLSTLRSYIEAMGGSLKLVVEFPDRAPVVIAGLTDEGGAPRPARKVKAAAEDSQAKTP